MDDFDDLCFDDIRCFADYQYFDDYQYLMMMFHMQITLNRPPAP